MPYFEHYPDKKICSLSTRMSSFVLNERLRKGNERFCLQRDNSKYNLASVIAQLILKIKFPILTEEVLKAIIEDYNSEHGTRLTITDFTNKSWLRFINGEYLIPEVMRYSLSITLNGHSNANLKIPNEAIETFRAMQQVYKHARAEDLFTIPQTDVDHVLASNHQVTEEILKKNELLRFNKEKNAFEMPHGSDHMRYLTDEIAMELWQQIMEPHQTIENFQYFLKVLMLGPTEWPGNFLRFTHNQALQKFHDLAYKFLSEEPDLEYSSKEMEKVYLDSPRFTHHNLFDEIPHIDINLGDAYSVVKEVRVVGWNYSDLFIHQDTRAVYSLVCHLIIEHPLNYTDPYAPLLSLFKIKNRPYLSYYLHFNLKRKGPELTPYLIADAELAPLFFYTLEDVGINENMLMEENGDARHKEKEEIRSALWLDAFSHLLSIFSKHTGKDNGYVEAISKILLNLTHEVFSFNSNNYNHNVIRHKVLRKRHETALKFLVEAQVDYVNTYPVPKVKPRLFVSILPSLFKALQDIPVHPARNEFIHVDSARVDLATEYLRMLNIRLLKDEGTPEQIKKFEQLKSDITVYLFNEIKNYFIITSVSVNNYSPNPEERKVIRGVSDFALEIIDWAFIYVHFYKYNLLDNFDQEFKNSIVLKSESEDSIYSAQNQEEAQKLNTYLKLLLLAHIGVTKNKTQFELSSLDAIQTLKKLESLITYYSLQYSKNKLEEIRINAFKENRSFHSNNFYQQALSTLLFMAANNFEAETKKAFISKFLDENQDLSNMLEALNHIDGADIKKVISEKIAAIDIESFINSRFHLSELEDALIESVNSESHYDIATPVLDRIEQHMAKLNMHSERSDNFIFHIKLLLAFKNKDLESLKKIQVPKPESTFSKTVDENERQRAFYIALHKLYNENNYEEAINSFEALHSQENKNVDFAFHLYRAKTLNAIKS